MKRYYCTYFDKNYLVKGLALIDSLNRHEENPFQIFVVCLDELTRNILNELNFANVKTIALHEIEQGDLPLLQAKQNRSLVEYFWTLTPTATLRILEKYPEIDVITYLDADLFFYSSPDPIFDELGNRSILIHEHRFSPSQARFEVFGKYNVGLLCFRNNVYGIEALRWWRDRCIEWCHVRFEGGKYADQGYLNDWPTRFKHVVVLQNIGAGVGPWNHIQYKFTFDSGCNGPLVNDLKLVFYHFHSLTFVEPNVIIPSKFLTNLLTKDILRVCFVPYINALVQQTENVYAVLPDFISGIRDEGVLDHRVTFLVDREMRPRFKRRKLLQCRIELDEKWDCYCSEQLVELSSWVDNIDECVKSGRKKQALSVVSDALLEFPHSPDLLMIDADLSYQGRDREDAIRKLVGLYPTCARGQNHLGHFYFSEGNKEMALHHYEEAAKIQPANAKFLRDLADFYYGPLDNAEGALRIYMRMLTLDPEDMEGLLCRAEDAALTLLRRRPDDVSILDAYYRVGLEMHKAGLIANAMVAYDFVAEKHYISTELAAWAYFKHGEIALDDGMVDEGRQLFEKAVALKPDHAKARIFLVEECEPLRVAIGEGAVAPGYVAVPMDPLDEELWDYFLGRRPADILRVALDVKGYPLDLSLLARFLERYVVPDGSVLFLLPDSWREQDTYVEQSFSHAGFSVHISQRHKEIRLTKMTHRG